jgi:hypothetical protein
MSKLQSFPYAGQGVLVLTTGTLLAGKCCSGQLFRFAISRRNGASHADEIILLLNWFRGTTFTFLSLKESTPCQLRIQGLAFFRVD